MEFFEISDSNGIRTVKINNPEKKNAMGNPAYLALGRILNTAADDDEVKCVVITGKGDFFCSGMDLTANFENQSERVWVHQPIVYMLQAFIRFPKLLIAIVNGPAVGIGATAVALCDVIYASETAYFYTPFTSLGLCAEGCSSVTFPKIHGPSKANEMLNLNHKLTASEAHQFGFVAHVYKNVQEVWKKLEQISYLPVGSIKANKKLTRRFTIEELEAANLAEAEQFGERFASEEAFEAITRFQQSRKRNSKL